jgi:hypothetical protein
MSGGSVHRVDICQPIMSFSIFYRLNPLIKLMPKESHSREEGLRARQEK